MADKEYTITGPDGRDVVIVGPDSATPQQLKAAAERAFKSLPPAQASAPAAPTNTAVGVNAANKAIAGVPDSILNTPTNLLNLGRAGFGTLATMMGRPDLAPELTKNPDLVRGLFGKIGLIQDSAQPATPGQRILDMTVQGATGALMSPANSVRQALSTAAAGGLSGLAAGGTKEATGSNALAQSVGILSPLAIAAARNGAQSAAQALADAKSRNAPRDDALRAGLAAGYKAPPATAVPSLTNKVVESIGGKAATQQDISLNNVEVTNALARKAIGLAPDAPITLEATRQVRKDAFAAGYAPLEQAAGTISTGRLYRQELDDIANKYIGAARSFPVTAQHMGKTVTATPDVVAMVNNLRVRSFNAGDAIKQTSILRENASKSFVTGDSALGNAQRAAANAIENQIERGLQGAKAPPELLQNFRDARQLMAKAHSVEDALKVGTGNVDANKIAAQLQAGVPLSGELRTIGEFANNFRKAVQTPQTVGSPGVSKVAALASMFMGGGGAAAAGPGGAALGAIPLIAPPIARGLLMSNRYQQGLNPIYKQGLLARGAANVSDSPYALLQSARAIEEEMRRQREGR